MNRAHDSLSKIWKKSNILRTLENYDSKSRTILNSILLSTRMSRSFLQILPIFTSVSAIFALPLQNWSTVFFIGCVDWQWVNLDFGTKIAELRFAKDSFWQFSWQIVVFQLPYFQVQRKFVTRHEAIDHAYLSCYKSWVSCQ